MSSAAVPVPAVGRSRLRWSRFVARRPEWWVVAIAAVAGAVVVADPHAAHHHPAASAAAGLPSWALMVLAMMLPVFVPRARQVARASLGRIRNRAIAETLAGYLLVWLAVGCVVVPSLPAPGAAGAGVLTVWWLAAAAWQRAAVRHRVLNRCHAVRVPPGARDGRRRVRAGMAYGCWCAAACGPAMAAAAVTGLPWPLMAGLAGGLLAERIARRPRSVSARLTAVMVAGALLAAVA